MLADGYQACSLITASEAMGRSLNRVRVEIKPIYQSMKLRTGGGIDSAFAGIIISREHSVHSCIKYTIHYGAHGLAGNWGYCEQEKAVLCTTHSCSPRTRRRHLSFGRWTQGLVRAQ